METNNEEIWFKTKGLEIAKEICKPYNSHCKEVLETIVKEANKIGIDCKIVEPLVVHGNDLNNNHYAIQYKNILIDYCLQQFLGDDKTVDYYTLWQSKTLPKTYIINAKTLKAEALILPGLLSDLFDDKWNKLKRDYLIETI